MSESAAEIVREVRSGSGPPQRASARPCRVSPSRDSTRRPASAGPCPVSPSRAVSGVAQRASARRLAQGASAQPASAINGERGASVVALDGGAGQSGAGRRRRAHHPLHRRWWGGAPPLWTRSEQPPATVVG